MKAILVARVSDPDQRVALPAQKQRLVSYADRQGFDYAYTEFDESAYKYDRKKFHDQVLLPLSESKEPVVVVFDKIDRYTRDSSSSEKSFLTGLLKKGRIELHFPSDNLFISKDSPATDLFRLDIGIALASYYSSTIRDNVKRRFEQKLRDGEWPGWAPVGYLNQRISETQTTIVPDPARADFVVEAYRLREKGQSFRAIAKVLNDKGMTSKSRTLSRITSGILEKVLKNPFYCGEMVYDGQTYPHHYDRLISPRLFEAVQRVNNYRTDKRTKTVGRDFVTKGLLRCAHCGLAVSADIKKGKYVYLKCNQFNGDCGAKRVREEVVLNQIKDVLRSITVPADLIGLITSELKKNYESEQRDYTRSTDRLRAESDKIDRNIQVMYQDRLDGRISAPEYDTMVAGFKKRQKDISLQVDDLIRADESFLINSSLILRLANQSVELFEAESSKVSQKRDLVNFVLSNLRLEGDKLLYNLKEPFDAMIGLSSNKNWLRRQDSNL